MAPSRRNSYILTQLDSANLRLENLFDEIGFSASDREDRERKVYSVIGDALEAYVSQIKSERDDLKHQCEAKQQEIQAMARAVPDVDLSQALDSFRFPAASNLSNQQFNGNIMDLLYSDSVIQAPYTNTYNLLSEAGAKIKEIYEERASIANNLYSELEALDHKLNGDTSTLKNENFTTSSFDSVKNEQALMEYQIEIKPEFIRPKSLESSDLSMGYLTKLDTEIQKLRHDFQTRVARVSIAATQIVALWADLGTPQNEIDSNIMTYYKTDPEKVGTTPQDMVHIENLVNSLSSEKERRAERIGTLSESIFKLWEKLDEDEEYMQNFEHSNRGLGLAALDAFEEEHARLIQKKKENVGVFIQDARGQLEQLWDKLYFSEKETYEFTPAWAEIFTDASLEAHEAEIERLEKLLAERLPIIKLIDQYRDLQNEEKELLASTQDASRLLNNRAAGGSAPKRDPSRLLREEQMRKRISKRKPKVMQELKAGLDEWLERTGEPFYIHGEDFSKVLADEIAKTTSSSRYGKIKPNATSAQAASVSKKTNTSGPSTSTGSRRTASNNSGSNNRVGSSGSDGIPTRPGSRAAGERLSPTKSLTTSKSRANLLNTPFLSNNSQSVSSPVYPPFGRPASPTKPPSVGGRQLSTVSPVKPSQSGRQSPTRPVTLTGRNSPSVGSLGRSATPTRGQPPFSGSPLRQASPTRGPLVRSATSLGMRTNPGSNTLSKTPALPHPARPKSVHGHRSAGSVGSITTVSSPTKPRSMTTTSGSLASPTRLPQSSSPTKSTSMHVRSRSELGNRPPMGFFNRSNSGSNQNPLRPETPPKNNSASGNGTTKFSEFSLGSLGSPTSHSTMLMTDHPSFMGNNNGVNGIARNGSVGSNSGTSPGKKSCMFPPLATPTKKNYGMHHNYINQQEEPIDVAMMGAEDEDATAMFNANRMGSLENTIVFNTQENANNTNYFSPDHQHSLDQNNQKQLKEMKNMQKSQRALQRLHAEAMAKAHQGQPAFEESVFGSPHGGIFMNGGNGISFGMNGGTNMLNTPLIMPNGSSTPLHHSMSDSQQEFTPHNGNIPNGSNNNNNNPNMGGMRGNVFALNANTPQIDSFEPSVHKNSPVNNIPFNQPVPVHKLGSPIRSDATNQGNDPNMNMGGSDFGDPMYQQWRQQALRQLGSNTSIGNISSGGEPFEPGPMLNKQLTKDANGDTNMTDDQDDANNNVNTDKQQAGRNRKERLSEFNWEKDTF